MQDSSPAGYWEGLLGRLTSTMSLTVRMPCRGRGGRAGDCWVCRLGRGRWRGLLGPWMGCGEERDPGACQRSSPEQDPGACQRSSPEQDPGACSVALIRRSVRCACM